MSIKQKLNKFFLYNYLATQYKKLTIKINPLIEINRCYSLVFNGAKPDLNNPQNLIEKIFWMELYADTSLWSKCTDKYRMREYVKECGLEEYLPKNLGVWYNTEDMSFDNLPNEFILKTNNGCGENYIVNDKVKLLTGGGIKSIRNFFKHALKTHRAGYSNVELHYLNIKPCVIAEELLHQSEEEKKFSPSSLVDYKVWCINGEPESILIVFDRKGHNYKLSVFDLDWNNISEKVLNMKHKMYSGADIPKPKCLEQMLEMAQKLSQPFNEVRVDFYVIDDKPVIGELTFSTGYGYFTQEYYKYLGSKIDLSKVKKLDIPNYKRI